MALSVVVLVGEAREWISDIAAGASRLNVRYNFCTFTNHKGRGSATTLTLTLSLSLSLSLTLCSGSVWPRSNSREMDYDVLDPAVLT